MSTPINKMRPIHPGEILREVYLKPLGWTCKELAAETDLSQSLICDILCERKGLNVLTAIELSIVFKTTANYWLNLQKSYDERSGNE